MASRRRAKKSLIAGLIALALAIAQQKGYLKSPANVSSTSKPAATSPLESAVKRIESSQPGLYPISQFIDGDTIEVNMNGAKEKVRLIGVDTPETHDPRKSVQCYGQAAANFTKNLIANNSVRLEADPTNTNRDRYGRLLRYVYLPDGQLVNAEIIKQGYGFAYTYFPFTKLDDFKSYQQAAEDKKLGLWGTCQIQTETNGQVHTQPAN